MGDTLTMSLDTVSGYSTARLIGDFRFVSFGGKISAGQQKWEIIHYSSAGKALERVEEWRYVDIVAHEEIAGMGGA